MILWIGIAEYERREKEAALAELSYLRHGSTTTGTDAVPLPPRRPRQQETRLPESPTISFPDKTEVVERLIEISSLLASSRSVQ